MSNSAPSPSNQPANQHTARARGPAGKATVRAGSNIAFIKYWGVQDDTLNIPLTNSISMTLADAFTTTTVEWLPAGADAQDVVVLDDRELPPAEAARLIRHLDRMRALANTDARAHVESRNNFPMASGIASSASGFAALSVAGCAALGLDLTPAQLSALARKGSGSASRSIFGGFVEWEQGTSDQTSIAHEIFPVSHWQLRDIVAIVSSGPKAVSSERGHTIADTSPFNAARIAAVPQLLETVRTAVATRDLALLGPAIEQDALAMHAVMMTGDPRLLYWQPGTLEVLHAVARWRAQDGLGVWFTIDAGPNVHLVCEPATESEVIARLRAMSAVEGILSSGPGEAPLRLDDDALQAHAPRG